MKRLAPVLLFLCLGCSHDGAVHATVTHADSARMLADVAFLASDALEGRGTGTAGNDSAAAYVARAFAEYGLVPGIIPADSIVCGSNVRSSQCTAAFMQSFGATSVMLAHSGDTSALPTQNVVAVVPGSDERLKHEFVVVGAHFDHLGRSAQSALDPDSGSAIRNGADDNASGTATVLELARLFASHPARRSMVFVAFSGEELGLIGSAWFVEHSPIPLERVRAMVNFDMVGRLRDNRLIVYGVETATELRDIVQAANADSSFSLSLVGDGYGPSDQSSFYARDIPVLHMFTDLHEDYHRATDDVERINAAGMARVTELAHVVIRNIADREEPLTFVRAARPQPQVTSSNTGVYLGTIPDMAAVGVTGARVTGVTAGSPADLAGMKAGDVIVEFGGSAVADLNEYAAALYAHKPGDKVVIVVMRQGERVRLEATLGRR